MDAVSDAGPAKRWSDGASEDVDRAWPIRRRTARTARWLRHGARSRA